MQMITQNLKTALMINLGMVTLIVFVIISLPVALALGLFLTVIQELRSWMTYMKNKLG